MNEEDIEKKNSPLVKAYQDKIEMLSNLVDTLETNKRQLDSIVANHEAHKIEYQKDQMLLNEILKDIDLKKSIQTTETQKMNELISKRYSLEQEHNSLEDAVNKKKEYVADIDSYPAKVKILQEEMEAFQNEHANNKKVAEEELRSIKETGEQHIESVKAQLKGLHGAIGNLIT